MKKQTKENYNHHTRHKPSAQLLDVYIRNNKKQALLVHVNRNTQLEHLARAIHARFGIPVDNQVLFHNGRTLHSKNTDKLQDKSIVHVVDNRNITPQITINVRRLNIPSSEQFTISSSQLIEDFIVRNIRDQEPDKMFLVYTGRHLNRRRTFAQEFVESESQLFCLHEQRDEVKGERRQKYQKIIKEQAAKNQKPVNQDEAKQAFEDDSGLQSYLPKVRVKGIEQQEVESPTNQANQGEGLAPNFKKKNITKEINLSSNELNLRQPPPSQQNLSLMVQNNFPENKSHGNSGFFNEGSSISQIIPQESHNSQNSKKNEEGSMFQSAFIGLNNQNSFVNQNQGQSRVNSAYPSQEQDMSEQSQKNSFSFDVRAPQLINLPADRHLTLIERQILQVTQSEELSRENLKQNTQRIEEQQQKGLYERQRDASIQNCQFELGQIQNHELSASAQMKVMFNEKQSPSRTTKNNEILIEDEDNNDNLAECQQKQKDQLLPISEELRIEQQKSNVEQEAPSDSLQGPNKSKVEQQYSQEQNSLSSSQNVKRIQELGQAQINNCTTPRFQQFPPQNIDIFFIEQDNQSRNHNQEDERQVQEQKFECQTNGPSSSSNFHSKNSSRVKNSQYLPNQYQFGDYHRPYNSAARRSGYNEPKPSQNDDLLFQKSRSQISRTDALENEKVMQQDPTHHNREDDQLQIVELPLDFRVKQQSSLLLDQYNDISKIQINQNKVAKQVNRVRLFTRKDSKIDELNNLISDLHQPKLKEEDDLLIPQSGIKIQNQHHYPHSLSPEKMDLSKGESDIKIETSLGNIQNQISKKSQSEQSLQRVQIKKTLNSYQSDNNLLDPDLKQCQNKQSFTRGQFVFRSEPNYFQPLSFYAFLFEKELGFRTETAK